MRTWLGIVVLVGLVALQPDSGRAAARTVPRGASLDATLRPYLARFGLPALGAAVVQGGRIVASGAVGTRRAGADVPVSVTDRFHIGSDTKAMTALLAAMFIEEGRLRWDTRVEEIYQELGGTMDAGLKQVTLTQLMSHTSGLPSDTDEIVDLLNKAMLQPGNLDQQRYWVVQQWAPKPLAAKPGETWAYSNLGYTILGAILERVGGKTWEELVATRVFDPLALHSAGFGPQSSFGRVDAPLGHALQDGKPFAYLAGPNGDHPAILGPAGTVHLSLLDFAAWAGWQAGEGRRGPALVRPEALRRMHTRVIDMPMRNDAPTGTPARGEAKTAGYALGWGEITLPFSPEPFVFHGGSNEKNYAVIMLQPKHDFAMVMMTNIGGPKSDEALRALGDDLYAHYAHR
jgi:CubicO group peptidase (beta-lactamase class C family)